MQQYFVDKEIQSDEIIELDKEVLHHLIKVLRKDSEYTFRIADMNGKIFHAHLIDDKRCKIDEFLDENNELDCDITCILSLIKSDKFELCIQKLTELGVKRIVPYSARRSVVKIREKKKLERFEKIARESSEQCHRNFIPEICDPCDLKDLKNYLSERNYICYESEKNISDIDRSSSVTYIIGPEGGFEDQEYEKIVSMGFESISLGKRILRAETAALYMTSLIVGKNQ
ncbi:MAG: 16S rRNA (uracil(1498)-N(3))-methyltransferase [Erysipelotrichaceae bacterium]|nr:16S rRNA (uracil(1498)-N(3))-methyltransferase [Erysipelotrichaceae bacterium]